MADLIERNNIPEPQAIRLVPGQQGLGLAPDAPRPGDATFEHDGRTVLTMEQDLAEKLDGRTLDVDQADGQTQLKLA
jgi:hypothetical protein